MREHAPDCDILIIASSPAVHRYKALEDFEYVKLPSVTKTGVERYRSHRLQMGLGSVIAMRSSLLLTAVQHIRPDLFMVDHRPLGLRQEVLPTLRWLREFSPLTWTVTGLRDIVDDAATTRREWAEQGIYEALENLYDRILVYGERSVFDPIHEYGLTHAVEDKIRFTGYLGRSVIRRPKEVVRRALGLSSERLVVAHAGGGGDGAEFIEAFLRSVDHLPSDVHSLVVTGPLMSPEDQANLRRLAHPSRVTLVDCQDDLAGSIAAADASVSMGGYNTVCETLSVGTPALVVPRAAPRNEQYIRAQRMASRGLLSLMHPAAVTPKALASAVRNLLSTGLIGVKRPVSLDGGPRAAHLLTELLTEDRVHRRLTVPAWRREEVRI
jgi:predicted glycosyltransferase